MNKLLLIKFSVIAVLTVLLLIPSFMIESVLKERKNYRSTVISKFTQSLGKSQVIEGVFFAIPYSKKVEKEVTVPIKGEEHSMTVIKDDKINRFKYLLPETTNIHVTADSQTLHRGIYSVPSYQAKIRIEGHFNIPKSSDIFKNKGSIKEKKPQIVLALSDTRGMRSHILLNINDQKTDVFPGSNVPLFPKGLHSTLKHNYQKSEKISFSYEFEIQGIEKISFLPSSKFNNVTISSDWEQPSFFGKFIPKSRKISKTGFNASWEISPFNSDVQRNFNDCAQIKSCKEFQNSAFGVSFYEGVDIYQKIERSIKYAIMFILLTFIFLFLFEVLAKIVIHPIQYTLVGAALIIFYLLLLALSEHMTFALSYLLASLSCLSLLGYYVSFILHSLKKGLIFSLLFLTLYTILYFIILSQDSALLMGTILLFALLGVIMISTRHVNWYDTQKSLKK